MIFQHTWQKVLDGSKTQTRRIIKPDQCLSSSSLYEPYLAVVQRLQGYNWKDVYRVGVDYAVQPGRGKPAVARIRITDIRREDVRTISAPDIRAEGFLDENIAEAHLNFLAVWAGMHDKPLGFYRDEKRWQWDGTWGYKGEGKDQLADTVTAFEAFRERPPERYTAWALTFCLVQP